MLFVALFAVGCTEYTKPVTTETPGDNVMEKTVPEVAMEKETPVEVKDTMEVKDSMEVAVPVVKGTSNYLDYSEKVMKAELEAGQKVVLFFHAKWCPFCVKADKAFMSSTDEIPVGVTVLKIDFDTEKEMAKKYGVTYQHTFVQLDKNLESVTKWVSGDIKELKKNLK